METPTPRHRHFVALPMVLLAVALGFTDASMHFPSILSSVSTVLQAESDERFTFDTGVYGIVYAGGEMQSNDGIDLRSGSLLLASRGRMDVQIGSFTVTSFDGVIHLTKGTTSVSIAAITAPVFVSSGDKRIVVPVGMQWEGDSSLASLSDGFAQWMRGRVVRPLPTHFIERVLSDVSIIRKPESTLPRVQYVLPIELLPAEDILLPVSERNKQQEQYEHILGYVRFVVENNDTERFEEIAAMLSVSDAMQSKRGQSVLAELLSHTSDSSTTMRMLLLQQLISDESLWMVSSFHPHYRDIAWALFEPDVSMESQLTRVFLFPYSFFASEDFSEFVLDRYAVAVHGIADAVGQKESFVEHLLEAHLPLVEKLEQRGYPLRAEFLVQTLQESISAFAAPTEFMKEARTELLQRDAISLDPLPPKKEPEQHEEPSEPEENQEPEVTLTPAQVEEAAYAMLEKAGALFTVHSSVSADMPNTARVTDIVFSSPTKDRSVRFSLNVVSGIVSSIEIDGNTDFPYEPTFDGFVSWIRK